VGDQVLAEHIPDGHYAVTVTATNLAGIETVTTLDDALWLVNGCQQFIAGEMNPNDNHWSISGPQGAETLGVDFGLYVTSLGGIEVADYAVSDFNFDASDVTLAECGIDVTHATTTLHAHNITLDGSSISVSDTAVRHMDADQYLYAGVSVTATGNIEMYGYGDTGYIGPMTNGAGSGYGGLITLEETGSNYVQQIGGSNVVASDAGIYLSAAGHIQVTVDGHTTAGVTLSQHHIGQGEDANVYVDHAHIDLLADYGLSLTETYTDITESGTYTLVDNGITRFETAQSTVQGVSGLNVELLQNELSAYYDLDASNAGSPWTRCTWKPVRC